MRSPQARRSWGRRRSTRHRDRPTPASPLRWSDRLIEVGALFLLVFTPLAYGTVEPWSEAIAELVVLGMVVVWIVGMLPDWELRAELPPGWLPASLFLALVFFQATPLPHALIGRRLALDDRPLRRGRDVHRRVGGRPAPVPRPSRHRARGAQARRRRRLLPGLLQRLPDARPGPPRPLDHDRHGHAHLPLRDRPAGDLERPLLLDRPRGAAQERIRALREPGALRGAHGDHRAHGAGAVARLAPDSHAEAAHSDLARPAARLELGRGRSAVCCRSSSW